MRWVLRRFLNVTTFSAALRFSGWLLHIVISKISTKCTCHLQVLEEMEVQSILPFGLAMWSKQVTWPAYMMNVNKGVCDAYCHISVCRYIWSKKPHESNQSEGVSTSSFYWDIWVTALNCEAAAALQVSHCLLTQITECASFITFPLDNKHRFEENKSPPVRLHRWTFLSIYELR